MRPEVVGSGSDDDSGPRRPCAGEGLAAARPSALRRDRLMRRARPRNAMLGAIRGAGEMAQEEFRGHLGTVGDDARPGWGPAVAVAKFAHPAIPPRSATLGLAGGGPLTSWKATLCSSRPFSSIRVQQLQPLMIPEGLLRYREVLERMGSSWNTRRGFLVRVGLGFWPPGRHCPWSSAS